MIQEAIELSNIKRLIAMNKTAGLMTFHPKYLKPKENKTNRKSNRVFPIVVALVINQKPAKVSKKI